MAEIELLSNRVVILEPLLAATIELLASRVVTLQPLTEVAKIQLLASRVVTLQPLTEVAKIQLLASKVVTLQPLTEAGIQLLASKVVTLQPLGVVPPGIFTLSGIVTDSTTTKAIAGVLVTLDTKQATTDQNGNYSFANLGTATYQVVFTKTGYKSVTKSLTISKNTVLNIQMTLSEEEGFPWVPVALAGGAALVIAVAATKKGKGKKKS